MTDQRLTIEPADSAPSPTADDGARTMIVVEDPAGQAATYDADLRNELRHRVRNLVSVVIALINDSLGRRPSAARVSRLVERLRSLEASGFCGDGPMASCRVDTLLRSVVGRFLDRVDSRVLLEGEDVLLTRRQADVLALIAHELMTNAVKHGALSTTAGRIHVQWAADADGRLHLRWQEQGGPAPRSADQRGYGLSFIERVAMGAKGKVTFALPPGGLIFTLDLPVGKATAPQ